MIIWTGWGIVIGIIGIACVFLTQLSINAGMQDNQFYQTHGWPKLLGLWLAAAVSWLVGRAMNKGEERQQIDPVTGEIVVVRTGGRHSLFFIPVQYWWVVFLILGVVFYFV